MKVNTTPVYACKYNQISNYGFNFALLNKDNQVYFTPFMCKDYLQDIFWSERTGHVAEIYGITARKGMIDDSLKTFKLALIWYSQNLASKIKTMTAFLNMFDDAQGIERTTIKKTEDESIVVVNFDRGWTENGPLLSTFTTAIRLSGAYEEGDVLEYLKEIQKKGANVSPNYMVTDVLRLPQTIGKFAAVLKGVKIDYPWSKYTGVVYAHNLGIVGWTGFPTAKV